MNQKLISFFAGKLAVAGLAKRQTQVALAILQGKSSQEIADDMSITIKMVKQHITNIYLKTKVTSRPQFIVHFYKAFIETNIKNDQLYRQNQSLHK
jgi:DNA-binding CsgD family transcriptional regulator